MTTTCRGALMVLVLILSSCTSGRAITDSGGPVASTTSAPPPAVAVFDLDIDSLRHADAARQAGVASYRIHIVTTKGGGEERFLAEFATNGTIRHRIDFAGGRWLETTFLEDRAVLESPDGTLVYEEPNPAIPWGYFLASPSAFLMCCARLGVPVGVAQRDGRTATHFRIEGAPLTSGVISGPSSFVILDADFWVDHAGFLSSFDLTVTGEDGAVWTESYRIDDLGADIDIEDPLAEQAA